MKNIPTVHFTLVRHGAASKKVFEYPSGHFLLRASQFFLSIFAFFDEKSFILKIKKKIEIKLFCIQGQLAVAQLAERSLPSAEICGSNPNISKKILSFSKCRKDENKEKEAGIGPFPI